MTKKKDDHDDQDRDEDVEMGFKMKEKGGGHRTNEIESEYYMKSGDAKFNKEYANSLLLRNSYNHNNFSVKNVND